MTLWQSIKRQNIDSPLSVRLIQPTCPPMLDSEPTRMHLVGAMCVYHTVRGDIHTIKGHREQALEQAGVISDSFRDQTLRWAGRQRPNTRHIPRTLLLARSSLLSLTQMSI